MDGKTSSDTGFTGQFSPIKILPTYCLALGPLGKALNEVTELEIDPTFKPITVGDDLIVLRPEIIKDLSPDQYYGYLMVKAIRSGILTSK